MAVLSYCPRMEEVNNKNGEMKNAWQDWGIYDTEEEAIRVAKEVEEDIAKGTWDKQTDNDCHLVMCVEVHDDDDDYRLLEIIEL